MFLLPVAPLQWHQNPLRKKRRMGPSWDGFKRNLLPFAKNNQIDNIYKGFLYYLLNVKSVVYRAKDSLISSRKGKDF